MKSRLFALFVTFSLTALAQPWSSFLNPSRAIDWSTAGFVIPSYTANCTTQPSLTANSTSAASANATAIQNALNSCDATHNVVNVPAGTFYVAGFSYGTQGHQVVRGAGPNATDIVLTSEASCAGLGHGVCMVAPNWTYSGDSSVLPPSGSRQCQWTGGYAQGSTSLTLSSCGGVPPVNQTIILDQANDLSDTGGVYMCDTNVTTCSYEAGGNNYGRMINSNWNSEQQITYITGVTSLGGGSYTVSISPPLYFTNIRSSQSPGVWWPGFVQNDGIENLTLDGTSNPDGTLSMFSCYQCWAKNIRFIDGARNDVLLYQSLQSVIRDSYFYGAQSHAATSYTIEGDSSSAFLIENNIFQQVTVPVVFAESSTGGVVSYNFAIKNVFSDGSWTWGTYASHATANNFNLFEGNDTYGIWADNASGPSGQITMFRNFLTGYQLGTTSGTVPTLMRALNRNLNYVGNVLGEPGFHTQYQTYATSTTAGTGAGNEYKSIYDFGWGGTGPNCTNSPGQSTPCDPLTFSTAMRWGNYDVANSTTEWNASEASPAANTYVNANFTASYFSALNQTLPASLYYTARPSWWPSTKAWPPIGPDVLSGNIGVCTGGTYSGAAAVSSSQCSGGTLNAGWAGHANSLPAFDCYLNVMSGPLDGSGSVLGFDANVCLGASSSPPTTLPASPSGLTALVQ